MRHAAEQRTASATSAAAPVVTPAVAAARPTTAEEDEVVETIEQEVAGEAAMEDGVAVEAVASSPTRAQMPSAPPHQSQLDDVLLCALFV